MTDGPALPQDSSFHRPALLGGITLAVLLPAILLWGVFARLSGAVIAPAVVEVAGGRQTLQHAEGGTMREILVREGDAVTPGQALIRLDDSQLLAERAILEDRLGEVRSRQARLAAEGNGLAEIAFPGDLLAEALNNPALAARIEGQRQLLAASRDAREAATRLADSQTAQIDARIAAITARRAALSIQAASLLGQIADQSRLADQGLARTATLEALKRDLARVEGEAGAFEAERLEALAALAGVAAEKAEAELRAREAALTALRDLIPAEAELRQRIGSLTLRIEAMVIRAPVAGHVLGLRAVTPGSAIRAAEPILQIVPESAAPVVIARLAPARMEGIHIGQQVELVLTSALARPIPRLHGRITGISADAINDPASHAPLFRVEIAPDPLPPGLAPLSPGQPVEARLLTGEMPALAWALRPFTAHLDRMLREP